MRDVRISDEVRSLLNPDKIQALCAGPEPGRFECYICGNAADADAEPINVLIIRHPTPDHRMVLNIQFAHAACAESAVSESDEVWDLPAFMGAIHLIPTLLDDSAKGVLIAGLMMEPKLPIIESAGSSSNAHVQMFLREGLMLLSIYDLTERLPIVPGWRAVLTPAETSDEVKVTILCDQSGTGRPRVIASEVAVHRSTDWLEEVSAVGTLVLYAGVVGMIKTSKRDPYTMVDALLRAARAGQLCGGSIEVVIIDAH